MSDETRKESNSLPNWFDGYEDQNREEMMRRRSHIENVATGDHVIVTDRSHSIFGHPLEVTGVSAPLILCMSECHDLLVIVDVRRHSFVHASPEYVKSFSEHAARKAKTSPPAANSQRPTLQPPRSRTLNMEDLLSLRRPDDRGDDLGSCDSSKNL